MSKISKHSPIKNRLSSLGLEPWDLGGGGDCFFHCLAPLVGTTVSELRHSVAQHMRDNELIYGDLGDFELYGGFQRCYRRLYFKAPLDIGR